MEIVGKVAATIQNVLGPEAEELGRATGVIQRRRKFTAVSLLRMLVLTLLRKPDAKATDFQSTAAQLGLDVTSTAVENRFTPQLVGFLRAVLERTVLRVLAASPQTVDLLNKFTSVRIGDSSTIALPDELADQFPGCGGILCAGLAAMKIHLLWDLLTGSILQLRITPGTQRRYQPDRPGGRPGRVAVAVRPGLLLSGSVPEPHAGRCFLDLSAAAWHVGLRRPGPALGAVAIPAAADRVGTDRRVGPAGREPSPALPIDRSAGAPRGGRPEATESLREGPEAWPRAVAGVSRMAGLDDLRDQLRAGIADVGGRRRALPRGGRSNLCSNSGSRTTGSRHTAGAAAEEQLAVVYVKLIAVLVQHWILLTATWCECRRSLMKAAAIIADWVTLLIDALDDLDRLIAILSRMKDVLLKAGARVQNRNIHPSLSQLLQNPILLDYVP